MYTVNIWFYFPEFCIFSRFYALLCRPSSIPIRQVFASYYGFSNFTPFKWPPQKHKIWVLLYSDRYKYFRGTCRLHLQGIIIVDVVYSSEILLPTGLYRVIIRKTKYECSLLWKPCVYVVFHPSCGMNYEPVIVLFLYVINPLSGVLFSGASVTVVCSIFITIYIHIQKFLNYLIQVWSKHCLKEELSENTCSYLHLCLTYMKSSVSCHVPVQFLVVKEC